MNEYTVVMVFVSSILTLQLKYKIMKKENNWISKGNIGGHTTISI